MLIIIFSYLTDLNNTIFSYLADRNIDYNF